MVHVRLRRGRSVETKQPAPGQSSLYWRLHGYRVDSLLVACFRGFGISYPNASATRSNCVIPSEVGHRDEHIEIFAATALFLFSEEVSSAKIFAPEGVRLASYASRPL